MDSPTLIPPIRELLLASLRKSRAPAFFSSSAIASSDGGTVRPSILAACALMTSSNLLACTTGKSAGFAPLSIRPAYTPAWRWASERPHSIRPRDRNRGRRLRRYVRNRAEGVGVDCTAGWTIPSTPDPSGNSPGASSKKSARAFFCPSRLGLASALRYTWLPRGRAARGSAHRRSTVSADDALCCFAMISHCRGTPSIRGAVAR
jgi:hypothetical protein